MTISISDPLTLFPYQAGLTDPPLVEAAAKAANDLATNQRAYKIGDPVPIVFCRRVNSNGGVLVSPGATEGRWENDGTTNELTVSLMVVLSEGQLATIPIKDCFVGPCRQGTWAQTYDRRAGTWTPGNYLTTVSGKQPWTAPYYCGTSGSYDNMTTLSCVNSYIDGSQRSNHQLHVFVRFGIEVTRIIDSTIGPSSNVIDLALYLMDASGRVPSGLIDTPQMLAAANFTDTNGLLFNGVYEESTNLDDWLEEISNDFLLRLTKKNGKFGFRPRLPVNVDHTINTGVIDWEFTFTEDHLLPDGFDIQYVPLTDRQPVCLQMMWRQQPESDIGFPRTTEIRFDGEATDGPFEQYDLSGFCTSENHAVKVGAYRLARRKLITHTLRLKVRPASYNSSLALGDIVRVRLRRETATTALNYHDYLYEVERIEKTASGACVFDLTHYPIDSQGRSLVALAVDAAVGPGVTLDPGRDDYSCDDNSATDNTGLPDTGIDYPAFAETPTSTDTDVVLYQPDTELPPIGPEVTPEPGKPIGDADNPVDPLEQTLDQDGTGILSSDGNLANPAVGDTLEVTEADLGCDGQVCWKKVDKTTFEEFDISCQDQAISGAYTMSITTAEIGYYIVAVGRCKDPGSPDGWGAPWTLGQVLVQLPYFWEVAWATLLYEEIASSAPSQDCSVDTITYNTTRSFTTNGGATGSVDAGLSWQVTNTYSWNEPSYQCSYPPGSGTWERLKPVRPDGTVGSTSSFSVGTPRVTTSTTSVRFVWWETGVAVGYGNTLAEAQSDAYAKIP
ncbi:hypothetical protein S-CBS1_gp17 [Synechococcus phage S-CBS1]|uniref:tail protein n=1 Tax=Synechococcus phage S-CBS1 TaxID=909297 RepID=UPI000231E28D|nr:tail protein [Synechococcus phage S-CBS1]ADP06622.1 hypothetical protein S-CBS1_gp17 [Synechococcus phage S-CBS1]